MNKNKQFDFAKQQFFTGIDVHKKNWTVTIRTNNMYLKTFSMNPSPNELARFMFENYPGGKYHSVYEAGYSGFWIHKQLQNLGFHNIVINPADVPTTHKEKANKRDRIDSAKLARELENGSLKGLYIPDEFHQQLRSLCRLRYTTVQSQTRVKNRIKGLLSFYGIHLPDRCEITHWSGPFIQWLYSLEFSFPIGKQSLQFLIEELTNHRQRMVNIIKLLRKYIREYGIQNEINYICSIPGIGFKTAITLYSELIDINRFPDLDHLSSYVGLVPSVTGSGERESNRGVTFRHNTYLRSLLIEAAWIAIRKDPIMTLKFSQLIRKMTKQNAIMRIAKKLLNRTRSVWKNNQFYETGVIS